MISHLDDTDDENCDDPIKLLPIGINNAVHFGNQVQLIGSGDINWKFPTDNLTHGLNNEITQRYNESNSECTISPMFIKLVDCVKFPWYFRKYTARLLQKTGRNQFENETEHDIIDVEHCDSDSSDCFIVEDLHPKYKSVSDKELDKHFKFDKELQTALKYRKLVQVDLKRNVGLIGMKISQKKFKTIKQDACAVRKIKKEVKQAMLHKEDMRSSCQLGYNEKPSNSLSVPVHFSNNKILEFFNNFKENKIKDHNNKDQNEHPKIFPAHELSKKVPTSTVFKKSSSKSTCDVKDIKKCNKYKNDQIKIKNKVSNKIIIGMLESNQISPNTSKITELEENCGEQSGSKQSDNKKEEPKSPILKCTTSKKLKPKPKPEIPSLVKRKNVNTKPQQKLDKIVNKLKMLNKIPPNVGSAVSKPWELPTKSSSTKETKDKVGSPNSVISEKLLHKLDKSMKYYNDHNKNAFRPGKLNKPQCMQPNANDIEASIPSNIVLTAKPITELNNHKIITPNTDSNKTKHVTTIDNAQLLNQSKYSMTSKINSNRNLNLEVTKQNTNIVSNSDVFSSAMVETSSKTNSSISENHYPTTNDCLKPQYIVHSLSKKVYHKNNSNNNIQNHNASIKILKSICDMPVGSKPEHLVHSTGAQMPRIFQNPQPQCQDSRVPNIYNSTTLDNQRNNFPNSFNQCQPISLSQCRLSNKTYQQANPVSSFYINRTLLPLPPPPPPMYVPPPTYVPPPYIYQTKQSYSNSSFSTPIVQPNQPPSSDSQDCVRSLQPSNNNNGSIIGVNNEGLVKKINIAGGPKSSNADPHELIKNKNVVSKISPAVHTNNIQKLEKMLIPGEDMSSKVGDDRVINGTNVEKSMEVAIMSKNRGASEGLKLSMDNINMQTKQYKGYSPPILPIPTYHKVLNQVSPKVTTASTELTKRNRISKVPMKKTDCAKSNKRKSGALNIADNRRQAAAKKISLEEYNKRTLKDSKSVPPKRAVSSDQNKHKRKRPKVDIKNNRDHNTETDLGYDSDSTVIL
ncbi:uncharacterized protein LOC111355332 [Spodoptera litura]|uniref:Uncharacterized protein LOC111355332 n=1 Tax=Spodoptera litura TaxID=69820 RepID=A0A9J7EA08_SPOLT|nr:uncharacterized protein LOC111355332 [Spodoptera litura]XP_022824901.1 uncharacterized protein LOC111355332 [Spodoptera litura]XP_022824902.1 uncharacterized protein LOC111355332 [Spodoptera litura]